MWFRIVSFVLALCAAAAPAAEISSPYLSLEPLKSQQRAGPPPLRIFGHAVQFINASVRGSAPQVPGLILS